MVPCYVNSRLTGRGIPVSCETDIYGALSEYIIAAATLLPPTLLDINNTVPCDMVKTNAEAVGCYKPTDLFMGFHCGNTPQCHLVQGELKHQLIMKRLLEPDKEPDISRGTLEGTLKPGNITLYRLQAAADGALRAYVAEGEALNMDPKSFGGIGVVAVKEMARFYRHVLIAKQYPHHAGVAFAHAGKALFSITQMLGVNDIGYNKPAGQLYCGENPFA
jgi:L-fucose isomerase-like protein